VKLRAGLMGYMMVVFSLTGALILWAGSAVAGRTAKKTKDVGNGTAYYAGAPGEKGIRFFDKLWDPVGYPNSVIGRAISIDSAIVGFNKLDPATSAKIALWDSTGGIPTIQCNVQTNIVAGFTLDDGVTPASVPNGNAYTLEASWDVPADPVSVSYGGAKPLDCRCFVGIEFDGSDARGRLDGGEGGCIMGLQWDSETSAWHVQSHFTALWGNKERIEPAPRHFAVKIVKKIAVKSGVHDVLCLADTQDTGLVTVYYSVDNDPWRVADSAEGRITDLPLTAFNNPLPNSPEGRDDGPDFIAYSICGNSASNLKIAVYGNGVPNVNLCDGALDFDGDGVSNDEEIKNGTSVVLPDARPGGVAPRAKRR